MSQLRLLLGRVTLIAGKSFFRKREADHTLLRPNLAKFACRKKIANTK